MNKIDLKNIKEYLNKEITVKGFVDTVRDLQYVQFLIIRDNTSKLQITIEKNEENTKLNEIVSSLSLESTIEAKGTLLESPAVKLNGVEFIPTQIIVTSKCNGELPINYKNPQSSQLDTKLDYRFLDLRHAKNNLMFKVQTTFVNAMREFLLEKEFIEIHTPKLIGAASESGADVFEISYFDNKAYLSQSPQFYKQMAMASGFEKIFEVGPVFRAEKSFTNRHTTEFTGFDIEFSYIDSYEDVMKLEEELLIYALTKVKEKYGDEIQTLFKKDIIIPQKSFPVIKLEDLYNELEKRYKYKIPNEEKTDLTTEAEKLSYKFSMEEYGSEFLFVTDYKPEKRPFYHMRKNGMPQGYDLIWKGVEITTGAQREHRYDVLKEQAEEKGLDKDVEFYLDFFKYGCPPHGGFGIGVDRVTMLLLGMSTIKESMFLFRGPNRLTP
ncbi:MAG: aspartate--tRNA(Asn) ligase [Clostridia bacterium]|nr:aspartate--tRNA(Asn) ligase [Clostridia bacterium]